MTDLDPRLAPWVDLLRRRREPDAMAMERLLAAIRAEPAMGGRERRIVLSPAGAVVAGFAIAVLTSAIWIAAIQSGPGTAAAGRVPVQFVLHAPGAERVTLLGDFNDWDPESVPMTRAGDGVWAAVVPLLPGTVHYAFLVDGREWRADANAASAPRDFGRPTSIALIGGEGAEP